MSDAFHERSFAQRFGAMGDVAETAFLDVNPSAHRTGVNRPEFSMAGMAATMRYTPDFMLADAFYEVMGCASRGDGTLKIKLEKLDALLQWKAVGPVHLWVYDSSRKRYWDRPIERWVDACHRHAELRRFKDNDKPYWALTIEHFPDA